MTFAAPTLVWLLLLAPASGLLAHWLWRRRRSAAAAWAARGLWDRLLPEWSERRQRWQVALLVVAVAAAGLALVRPRWGSAEETVEREGIDVVIVLDTSLSMAAADVAPSRFFAAQSLVRRLVAAMPGNRVALVQAEATGEALTPLTLDAAVIDLLLDAAQPGSLPTPGTELAPAIATAIELFSPDSKQHRAIVLVTDGEDHGGHLEDTLRLLRDENVTLFALGVGTPQGSPLPVPGEKGAYKRDQDGRVVVSRLGEEALERMATESGGVYLRATNPGVDLDPLLAGLAAIEGRSLTSDVVTTAEERFQWPLAVAVAALLALLAVPPFRAAGSAITREAA